MLIDAVRRFEKMRFEHSDIIENAKQFDKAIFKQKFAEFVHAAG